MKRSYIRSTDGVRLACDSVIALIPQEFDSPLGGKKVCIKAATATGYPVLAECYPHEVDAEMDRWTRTVFGGKERQVEERDSGRVVQ